MYLEEKQLLEDRMREGILHRDTLVMLKEKGLQIKAISQILEIEPDAIEKLEKGTKKHISLQCIQEKERKRVRNELLQMLSDSYYITKEDMDRIKKKTQYKDMYIIQCLEINPIQYKSVLNNKRKRISTIREQDKRKILELKMDMKYLARFGEREYAKSEIRQLCKEYEVPKDLFIRCIVGKERNHTINTLAFHRKKNSVYIGNNKKISQEFWEKNQVAINKRVSLFANNVASSYQCWDMIEDFKQEALIDIWQNGGKSEINFENDLAILLVTKKSKYAMLKFYQKMSHELSLIQEVRGEEFNLLDVLPDDTYNPEKIVLEKEDWFQRK